MPSGDAPPPAATSCARGRRLWLGRIIVALLLLPHCAHTQRPRTIITGTGDIIRVHDRAYGCGGELIDEQIHRQLAGGLEVHHETAGGFRIGGSAEVLRGALHEYFGDELASPRRSPYTMGSLGFRAGYNAPEHFFTFDAGLRLYMARARMLMPLPWLSARLGDPEQVWLELREGPVHGAFDPVLLGGGIGFIAGVVTVRTGLGLGLRRMVGQLRGDDIDELAVYRDGFGDPMGWLNVRLNPSRYFSVGIYAAIGRAPSGRLTLSFAIPHEDSEADAATPRPPQWDTWATRQAE
ncbi:MAG: hypothetical protein H6744_17760 [Deltaproteobacteria bacterium]|nr:hypothetical protein [Deltaproteobacteria bacterium]